jgi:uncharacterized protein YdaU (DUF1376 family)
LNYYPWHIGDYAKDTAHLSILEDGAYRRMLDVYYASERPLPRDQQAIYRLVRARTHAEKLAVDVVLGEFWVESDEGWRNARADAEIARVREKSEKARGSAALRWHAERNANASPRAMRTHSEGNAPNNQEPRTKEEKGNVELTLDAPARFGKTVSTTSRELRVQAIELLSFLNEKAGRNYQPVPANIDMIVARLKEGATLGTAAP